MTESRSKSAEAAAAAEEAKKANLKVNEFIVADSQGSNDSAAVLISQARKDALGMWSCVAVLLKGKNGSGPATVCIGLPSEKCETDSICMNYTIRNNLRVGIGDVVSMVSFPSVFPGLRVHVNPINYEGPRNEGWRENLIKTFLKPYFLQHSRGRNRPIHEGDEFGIRGGRKMDTVNFKVTKTEPGPYCLVHSGTVIFCAGVNDIVIATPNLLPINSSALEARLRMEFIKNRQGAYAQAAGGINTAAQLAQILQQQQNQQLPRTS